MNEKKLAAIAAAYGDAWEKVKEHVDENGWSEGLDWMFTINSAEPEKYTYASRYKWRPISLSGIENNNGWIRCDDHSKSPHDESRVHVFRAGEYWGTMRAWELKKLVNKCGPDDFTHWKPVEEVKPPIY